MKSDEIKIYEILRDQGYYFANVEIFSEDKSKNIVDIMFKIDLGDKTKISKITFTGDKFFKDKKLNQLLLVKNINHGNLFLVKNI